MARRILDERTTWRMHQHGRAALLIDVADYYRAFYEAASRAQRSILLLGWQFDSDVQLVRGSDLPPGGDPTDFELLPVLDRLCREKPALEVKVLAWDHSVFFALEREVLQKVVFDLATNERLAFKVDGTVPFGGSHHQKVAIIDGQIAFMGSADICQDRWDTSAHALHDPHRTTRSGEPNRPYHEVQAVFEGEVVSSLLELFACRWKHATGEALDQSTLTAEGVRLDDLTVTLPMPDGCVALSRTVPAAPGRERVHEIRDLYARAIREAERLIYIETQYLTSNCVRDALVARMGEEGKSKLDIVLVIPHKPSSFKEEITIGEPQAAVLEELRRAAETHGHRLGVYNVAASEGVFVYIHAKLMIVDDRIFTMGSANLANRSMTVDSEINATWVAPEGDRALQNAIRCVRVRLLLEHLGDTANVRDVVRAEGLVTRLDALAAAEKGRLRRHDSSRSVPNALARAVQELACDFVDPPPSSISV